MAHAIVIKEFKFSAAHKHPHAPDCNRWHGHNYRVEVALRGAVQLPTGEVNDGMVYDFRDIKAYWESELEPLLDHQNINDTLRHKLPFAFRKDEALTTVEHLARWLFGQFEVRFAGLQYVRVWETDTASAMVTRDEWVR